MTMLMVNIAEAKAKLSEYVDAVAKGEHVIICNRNRPVAELRAIEPARVWTAGSDTDVPRVGDRSGVFRPAQRRRTGRMGGWRRALGRHACRRASAALPRPEDAAQAAP